MAITLDLQYKLPDDFIEGSYGYIPVSPDSILGHNEKGWTVFDLETLAFDGIPLEFTDARIEIGKRLQRIGEDAILHAYGPVEGGYYIKVPPIEVEAKETGILQDN